VTEYEKEEFWKGLTRLYDATLKLNAFADTTAKAIADLRVIVVSHERRLKDLEDGKQT